MHDDHDDNRKKRELHQSMCKASGCFTQLVKSICLHHTLILATYLLQSEREVIIFTVITLDDQSSASSFHVMTMNYIATKIALSTNSCSNLRTQQSAANLASVPQICYLPNQLQHLSHNLPSTQRAGLHQIRSKANLRLTIQFTFTKANDTFRTVNEQSKSACAIF